MNRLSILIQPTSVEEQASSSSTTESAAMPTAKKSTPEVKRGGWLRNSFSRNQSSPPPSDQQVPPTNSLKDEDAKPQLEAPSAAELVRANTAPSGGGTVLAKTASTKRFARFRKPPTAPELEPEPEPEPTQPTLPLLDSNAGLDDDAALQAALEASQSEATNVGQDSLGSTENSLELQYEAVPRRILLSMTVEELHREITLRTDQLALAQKEGIERARSVQ